MPSLYCLLRTGSGARVYITVLELARSYLASSVWLLVQQVGLGRGVLALQLLHQAAIHTSVG